jgi:DNA recombination-dependent growth factor C
MKTHTTFRDVQEANHEKEGWTSPQGSHEKVSLVVNQA